MIRSSSRTIGVGSSARFRPDEGTPQVASKFVLPVPEVLPGAAVAIFFTTVRLRRVKISWHRRCPSCGRLKVTKRYDRYFCERCKINFKGMKFGFWIFVIRIAWKP